MPAKPHVGRQPTKRRLAGRSGAITWVRGVASMGDWTLCVCRSVYSKRSWRWTANALRLSAAGYGCASRKAARREAVRVARLLGGKR